MADISIIRESTDKLRRETWRFWYYESRHQLVLDTYEAALRPTRRHAYRRIGFYYRLDHRINSIPLSEVPMPESVMDDAHLQFTSTLSVVAQFQS